MELAMIGLGRMGANMAERLVRGGHTVRGYDPGLGRWVQYAIDNSGAGFERLEGEAAEDGIDLAPPPAGGPPRVREVVTLRADGSVVWERETTGDRGRIWQSVVSAELARR